MSCLAVALSASAPIPAGAVTPTPPTLLGSVNSARETSIYTVARDGGVSVALPNGKALWVFGDTVAHAYENGAWRPKMSVAGSTATIGSYLQGHRPTAMYEVNIGQNLAFGNLPSRFVPAPTAVYMPDGSGKLCTRANGALENGRWPIGAALMPDQQNVIITYAVARVPTLGNFTIEGWGFMEYNYTTNAISVAPVDVFPAATSGAKLASEKIFGSPVVANNTVTLFSGNCCSPGHVYATTVAANTTALHNKNSYVPVVIAGLPAALSLSVSVESASPHKLQMFEQTGLKGQFSMYSATSPTGPWTKGTSGTLPGCQNAPNGPVPCSSVYGHPELSTTAQLLVSYYLPGYGPGVGGHPTSALAHVVLASITVGTPLPPLKPTVVRAVSNTANATTGSLKVSYGASLNNGSTITKYTAACVSSNGGLTKYGAHYGATAAPITVSGVSTPKTYTCTVRAWNAKGASATSAPSKPVIVGSPSAPTAVKAVKVVSGRLRVTFNASAPNGAPILSYSATCVSSNGGLTRSNAAGASPVLVGSLSAGKRYTCTVKARNSRGFGLVSLASPAVLA